MKKLAMLFLVAATVAGGLRADIAPYPITIDSQSASAPALELYRSSDRTIRVTFKDGGTATSTSGLTPFFSWSTNATAATVSTATCSVVVGSTGVVDCAFTAASVNYAPGRYVYEAGLRSGSATTVYRQGVLVLRGSPYASGAGSITWQQTANWLTMSRVNWPTTLAGYGITNSYTAEQVDALIAAGGGGVTNVQDSASIDITISNRTVSATVLTAGITNALNSTFATDAALSAHTSATGTNVHGLGTAALSAAGDFATAAHKHAETNGLLSAESDTLATVLARGNDAVSGVISNLTTLRFAGSEGPTWSEGHYLSVPGPYAAINPQTSLYYNVWNGVGVPRKVWDNGNDGPLRDGASITNAPWLPLTGGTMAGDITLGDYTLQAQKFGVNAALGMSTTNAFIAVGRLAGWGSNHGEEWSAVGMDAGIDAIGSYFSAYGYRGGYHSVGNSWCAFGRDAGSYACGDDWTAIGQSAGYQHQGTNWFAIGQYAGYKGSGSHIGYIDVHATTPVAGYNPTNDSIVINGSTATLYLGRPTGSVALRGTVSAPGLTLASLPAAVVTNNELNVTLGGGFAVGTGTAPAIKTVSGNLGIGTNAPTGRLTVNSTVTNVPVHRIVGPSTYAANAIVRDSYRGTTLLESLDEDGDLWIDGGIYSAGFNNLQVYANSAYQSALGTGTLQLRSEAPYLLIEDANSGGDDWDFRVLSDESYFRQKVGDSTWTERFRLGASGGLWMPALSNAPSAKTGYAGVFCVSNELWTIDSDGNKTLQTTHDGQTAVHRSYNDYTGEGRVIDLDAMGMALQALVDGKPLPQVAQTLRDAGKSEIYRVTKSAPLRDWNADQDAEKAKADAAISAWESNTNAPALKGPRPEQYIRRTKPQWLKDWEAAQ